MGGGWGGRRGWILCEFLKKRNVSLSQQRQPVSPREMKGWYTLSAGSRHEGLADGGCSCSQVGEQAEDWLAFPLEQAHLNGEFTVRPFYLGILSDWASSKELKVHTHFFPHVLFPPLAFLFSPLPPSFKPELSSRSCAPEKRKNVSITRSIWWKIVGGSF